MPNVFHRVLIGLSLVAVPHIACLDPETKAPNLPCNSPCCAAWCNTTYAGLCGQSCCRNYLVYEDVCQACMAEYPQCTNAPSPAQPVPDAGTALVGFLRPEVVVYSGAKRVSLSISLNAAPDFVASNIFVLVRTADPTQIHTAHPAVHFEAAARIVTFTGLEVPRSTSVVLQEDVQIQLGSSARFNESFVAVLSLVGENIHVKLTQRQVVVVLEPQLVSCMCHKDCEDDFYCMKGPPTDGTKVCVVPGQCMHRNSTSKRTHSFTRFNSPGGGSCCENAGDCADEQFCQDGVCRFFDTKVQHSCARDVDNNYPTDVFTCEEKRHGAALLHCIGILYVFASLAIVCDDYFVPALEVLVETWGIKDDVAGATFMAAGGSAPELFTSVMGVFVALSDVGFGTIVGSAVFNILLVIGACSFCAGRPLDLTWWPLARDSGWYLISIGVLYLVVTNDNSDQIELTSADEAKVRAGLISEPLTVIVWWEALLLLGIYVSYVTFMYFNEHIEVFTKNLLQKRNKVVETTPMCVLKSGAAATAPPISETAEQKPPLGPDGKELPSVVTRKLGDSEKAGSGGWMADAAGREVVDDETNSITEVQRLTPRDGTEPPADRNDTKVVDVPAVVEAVIEEEVKYNKVLSKNIRQLRTQARITVRMENKSKEWLDKVRAAEHKLVDQTKAVIAKDLVGPLAHLVHEIHGHHDTTVQTKLPAPASVELMDPPPGQPCEDEPPDKWYEIPDGLKNRLSWAIFLPVNFLFAVTIPDCRFPERHKWFLASFFISILWIAFYSYWMVWWVTEVANVLEIPVTVMGVTVLAAGTSVPDLITSVIVARRGLGDMAVSSSIGSNIFDLCMGLPLPWAVSNMIIEPIKSGKFGKSYTRIGTEAMEFSIFMLFALLGMTVLTIVFFKWRIGKPMGVFCIVMYFIFITLTILAQTDKIDVEFGKQQAGCSG